MFVPSHTRGVVTLPGTKMQSLSTNDSSSCCHSKESDKPTREQRKRCAVCFVASALSTPTVYVMQMRPIECIGIASIRSDAQVLTHEFPAPFWPTGPPASL